MTDELVLLDETVGSIFERHLTREARGAAADGVPAQLWRVLDDSGLTSLAMPEGGGGLPEVVVLARAVGRAAAPVPLVEMAGLASWLLASAGLPLQAGITTAAVGTPRDDLRLVRTAAGWTVDGSLLRVPWGIAAQRTVALAHSEEGLKTVVLPVPSRVRPGRNNAQEPRDTLQFDGVVVPEENVADATVTVDELLARGALLRSAAMAGAMERVLDMTLAHADQREQFGRPISSFQAVQHHLVAIAEESVCTSMAVRVATVAEGREQLMAIAAAKATAGAAAQVVTARAHQVHGAIGTTEEHSLHWYTTRLWSWQDEFGTAQMWARRIGQDVLGARPEDLWPRISATVRGAVTGTDVTSTFAGQS
jgi:acyl-CoA dehydrogenase